MTKIDIDAVEQRAGDLLEEVTVICQRAVDAGDLTAREQTFGLMLGELGEILADVVDALRARVESPTQIRHEKEK